MPRSLLKCIVLNICYFLSFLCDSCHGNMKNKSHGSLLFKFAISLGERGQLTRQARDIVMDQEKRLFLFLLHNILHFYFIIVVNVTGYHLLLRSCIIHFPNIMSFHHHYHPMAGLGVGGVISHFVDKNTG